MSIKTTLQALDAIRLEPRVTAALRAIQARAELHDGFGTGSDGDKIRHGGTPASPVERAAGALLPLDRDRDAILAHIAALQTSYAVLTSICDRYIDIAKPTQCIGGAGYDWWAHRRTTTADCTNWASVGPNGTPNRGGLCDACAKAAQRHGKVAA